MSYYFFPVIHLKSCTPAAAAQIRLHTCATDKLMIIILQI
jgi:hypothetical protein